MNYRIREYVEEDFESIHNLNELEGWSNLVENHEQTKQAWNHSPITLVAEGEDSTIIGYLRGLTDGSVTAYICEMLINPEARGEGIGHALLTSVHDRYPTCRIEMLASTTSKSYYEQQSFRTFYGFRKASQEW
ncbi:GNAT family N-acetyltransferase [Thalassobacillus hwangdonensis]|uniref:GNAT family N-acetyltransferase n=1 Tax=Thalassobacillus hwangdonensis TaxID=546108 RepID=A0ABW3L4L8_9BACI